MLKKKVREHLEDLMTEIHATAHETDPNGEICLSPMVGETLDADATWTSEGDENDELFA